MDYNLSETTYQRACKDTRFYFGTIRFWVVELLITAGLTIWVLLWTPIFAEEWHKVMYQILIPMVGAILGLGFLFLFSLVVAPVKQRNEARKLLLDLEDNKINIPNKTELLRAIEHFKESAFIVYEYEAKMNYALLEEEKRTIAIAKNEAVIRFMVAVDNLANEMQIAGEKINRIVSSLIVLSCQRQTSEPIDVFPITFNRKVLEVVRKIHEITSER